MLDNHKAIDYLAELFPRSNNETVNAVRSRLGRKIRIDLFEAAAQLDVNLITTFAPLSPGTLDFMRQTQTVVEQAGGIVLFVQLLPSHEVLLARVESESRLGKKLDSKERWQEVVAATPAAFETFPDVVHCVLDNSDLTPADAAKHILRYYHLPESRHNS